MLSKCWALFPFIDPPSIHPPLSGLPTGTQKGLKQQWRGLGWRRTSGRLRSLLKVVPLWWWWEWAEVWNPRSLAAWTWCSPSKSSSPDIVPEQSLGCIGLDSMELAPWTHIGLALLQLLFISCLPRGTVSKRMHSIHGWMFPLPLLWRGGFDLLLCLRSGLKIWRDVNNRRGFLFIYLFLAGIREKHPG